MDRNIARALLGILKHQVVQAKHLPDTRHLYSDSYAYAVSYGVYPFGDVDVGFAETREELIEADPPYEGFEVGRDLVKEIAELLDEHYRSQQRLTFYNIEDRYRNNWRGRSMRYDLIRILRYLYLKAYFDDDFWAVIRSDCPAEAHGIDEEFRLDELRDSLP